MECIAELAGVKVRRSTTWLLDDIHLSIGYDERWVVVGPNGAGKTTLLSIIAARMFPTSGAVRILGEELGAVDLTELRQQIGWASSALVHDIPTAETVANVVMTGAYAVTGRWREQYGNEDAERARSLLGTWGLTGLAHRTFGSLSEGERKRTLIARSLMPNPELLLLDEPGAGLDLGGREDLVTRLSGLALDELSPAIVMVTHHVEEIPSAFTHALVLSGGRAVAAGPIESTLTSQALSVAYGLPISVQMFGSTRQDRRWTAHAGGFH